MKADAEFESESDFSSAGTGGPDTIEDLTGGVGALEC
jgi:hypothetical protein